jgi:uncharacterized surface protein with fasciclin (FAS1) repeats
MPPHQTIVEIATSVEGNIFSTLVDLLTRKSVDNFATNGVVHVIDAVLIPPNVMV